MKIITKTTKLVLLLALTLLIHTDCRIKKLHIKNSSNCTDKDVYCTLPFIAHGLAYDAVENKEIEPYLDNVQIDLMDSDDIKFISGITKSKENKAVVVAFRGTDTFDNALTDANSDMDDVNMDKQKCKVDKTVVDAYDYQESGCRVHSGFNKYYNKLQQKLKQRINTLLASDNSIKHIIFTGHSLGGAIATLAVPDVSRWLEENGNTHIERSLITFGSPRVGNAQFAHYVDVEAKLKENFRVTYNKDPVTCVPAKKTDVTDVILYAMPLSMLSSTNEKFFHVGIDIHFTNYKEYILDTNDDSEIRCSTFSPGDHTEYKKINENSFKASIEAARAELAKDYYNNHQPYKTCALSRRKKNKKMRKMRLLHKRS